METRFDEKIIRHIVEYIATVVVDFKICSVKFEWTTSEFMDFCFLLLRESSDHWRLAVRSLQRSLSMAIFNSSIAVLTSVHS